MSNFILKTDIICKNFVGDAAVRDFSMEISV